MVTHSDKLLEELADELATHPVNTDTATFYVPLSPGETVSVSRQSREKRITIELRPDVAATYKQLQQKLRPRLHGAKPDLVLLTNAALLLIGRNLPRAEEGILHEIRGYYASEKPNHQE